MKRILFILLSFFIIGVFGAGSVGQAATYKPNPLPPRNIKIRQQNNNVFLTWKKPATKNFSGFRIYRSQIKNKSGKIITSVDKNTFSFKDSIIQMNTTYFYTIRTLRKDGKKSTNKKQYKIVVHNTNVVNQQSKILSVTNTTLNVCEVLLQNGNPNNKINIVFIPDGAIPFVDYKDFIELFFSPNTVVPYSTNVVYQTFTNTAPFKNNLEQFNFYSIWKEENYGCKDGNFDCEIKMRKLAENCPINRTYDGITIIDPTPIFSPTGRFGKETEICTNTEPKPKNASYALSTDEQYQLNICPGMSHVGTAGTGKKRFFGILHEWGHMIGNLPHPERPSIMAYPPFNTDYFDPTDTAQLCQKISEAIGVSAKQCAVQ